MNDIQIQTTQNVSLTFVPASVSDRIFAHVIDWFIFLAWGILGLLVISQIGNTFGSTLSIVMFSVFLALPIMCYDLLCEVFMNGQTIGKKAMDINVISLSGTQPTLGAFLIRWLFRLIEIGTFNSFAFIALITVLVNGKGQRLGDIVAGTAVVKTRRKITLAQLRQEKLQDDYQVVIQEAFLLSDNDVVVLRAVLKKSRELQHEDLADIACIKIKDTFAIISPLTGVAFLKQVLKDHLYLTTHSS